MHIKENVEYDAKMDKIVGIDCRKSSSDIMFINNEGIRIFKSYFAKQIVLNMLYYFVAFFIQKCGYSELLFYKNRPIIKRP